MEGWHTTEFEGVWSMEDAGRIAGALKHEEGVLTQEFAKLALLARVFGTKINGPLQVDVWYGESSTTSVVFQDNNFRKIELIVPLRPVTSGIKSLLILS